MKLPTIGELRHRVRLEVETRTSDGGGGATAAWLSVETIWAAIRDTGGREVTSADGRQARATHEIWIRFRAGVSPNARLVKGAQTFDVIAALDPDGAQRWLRCLVEERLA